MFSASQILQNKNGPEGDMNDIFFWFPEKENKSKCLKMGKQNAFLYVTKFLPAFGFYKYREHDQEEGSFLVVQKNGRRVRILGNERDFAVQDRIFEWTLETLKFISKEVDNFPTNLESQVFQCSDLFSKWTIRFLPRLPDVPTENEKGEKVQAPQQPLLDTPGQSYVCFKNGVVVVHKDEEPEIIPYDKLPPYLFIWDKEIKEFDCSKDMLREGPRGKWWDFLQNVSKEDTQGEWRVNQGMLETLTTAYGYLLHNFYPPDQRKVVILYDRTEEWKAGGNGKSILAKSFGKVKPTHFVDMKQEKSGDNRFLLSGYTPDKRIVVLSDTSKEYKLENHYNLITDGFTVEDKNEKKYVLSEQHSPKLILTTNYTIPDTDRSDRRRQFFVPIGTFYGTLLDQKGQTPADLHGGWLLDNNSWKEQDWGDFYATCVYCIHEYLKNGLEPFDDQILADRQLLKTTGGDELLLLEIRNYISSFFKEGESQTELSRNDVINFYSTVPELDKYAKWQENWKVRTFKKVASGLGYQVNPGRSRYQKIVNGSPMDFYVLVRPLESDPIANLEKAVVPSEPGEDEALSYFKALAGQED